MIKRNRQLNRRNRRIKVVKCRGDIKNWISFGINNGYVNKFKKDEIAKWTELMLKHGVIKMDEINKNI